MRGTFRLAEGTARRLLLTLTMPTILLGVVTAAAQRPPKKTAKTGPTVSLAVQTGNALADRRFESEILPFVQKYCVSCHSGSHPAGGMAFQNYRTAAQMIKGRNVWERMAHAVNESQMPPKTVPQPTQAERDKFVQWIESTLSQADCKLDDPGRVTMRRLNREEYNNTIRDLTGLDIRPADNFPSDDVGYGFDNIGDVLSISPLMMEKYLAAAEKIAKTAILAPETTSPPIHVEGNQFKGDGGEYAQGGRILATTGETNTEVNFPQEGVYTLRVQAFAQQGGNEPAKMSVRLDGKEVQVFEVKAVEERAEVYTVKVTAPAGKHLIGFAFLNDFYQPASGNQKEQDRNLIVQSLDIQVPFVLPAKLPESHRRILFVQPTPQTKEATAKKIVAAFARRAFRRPVTPAEVERLARYVKVAEKEGESFERGIQLAVTATLVSPHFLFRVEIDPQPANPKAKRLLNDYELASRLSYFLWSTMPDEELWTLAAQKKLQAPRVLAAQVKRMLQSPKAKALATNFGGQWLTLRRLETTVPDTGRFPTFNDKLRAAMRTETEMFFEAIQREDRSLLDFIDGKFTFLNEPLAKHYGINGVQGENFRKVELADARRGGVLTHASILTVTSNPTRTSPVKRGKWVLEQLLGTPPPPAPPNVPELKEDKKGELTGTLRQKMEQHRKDPLCNSCHARLDPLGFGLENFDAVGAWRDKDGPFEVDSSGTLPDGKSFRGPAELKGILKAKKALFTRNLADKMLTYALGRGTESYDRCEVDKIAAEVATKEYRFSALVTAVVMSDPFRMRRGDGGTK